MRQIVIHLSSPTYTILSLYNLFSTLHPLFSSRFYTYHFDSVTAGIPNPSVDTARASPPFAGTLCLLLCCRRSVPSRPSRRHARVHRCAVHSSCTLCLLLCCRSIQRDPRFRATQCDRAYRTPFSGFECLSLHRSPTPYPRGSRHLLLPSAHPTPSQRRRRPRRSSRTTTANHRARPELGLRPPLQATARTSRGSIPCTSHAVTQHHWAALHRLRVTADSSSRSHAGSGEIPIELGRRPDSRAALPRVAVDSASP